MLITNISILILPFKTFKNKTFELKIPGMFLDSSSKAPIQFIVSVHDKGQPRLSNEIIINVKIATSFYRPIYFETPSYNFEIIESQKKVSL